MYPNGYNISPGGNARNIHCYVKVYQFDLNKILIAEYLSMVEASIKTGILITKISDCCNGRTVTAGDFYWSKYPYLPDNIEQYRHKKRVVQYTLDGKLVGVFDSTIQAGYSFTSDDKKHNQLVLIYQDVLMAMPRLLINIYGRNLKMLLIVMAMYWKNFQNRIL